MVYYCTYCDNEVDDVNVLEFEELPFCSLECYEDWEAEN